MGTVRRMFQLNLKKREATAMKRVIALVMIPIFVLQMCSINLFLTQVARADDSTGVVADVSADIEEEEAEEEEAKEEATDEEEVDEVIGEVEADIEEPTEAEEPKEEPAKTEVPEQPAVQIEEEADEEAVLEIEASVEASAEDSAEIPVEVPAEATMGDPEEVVEIPAASPEEIVTENEEISEATEEASENVSAPEPEWEMSNDGKTAEITPVEIGKTYEAPQNEDVTVTFTDLPENPGSLKIEEITLTEEQVAELDALSNKAYDITSSMENGTFEFDLTLPKPSGAENVQIKYAEEESGLDEARAIDDVDVRSDKVKAEGINHFTIFFIVFIKSETNQEIIIGSHVYNQGETVSVSEVGLLDSIYCSDWKWWGCKEWKKYYYKLAVTPLSSGNIYPIGDCTEGGASSMVASYDLLAPNNITPGNWKVGLYQYKKSDCSGDKTKYGESLWPSFEVKANPGSITIIEDSVPDDSQAFNFTGNLCNNFTLDDDNIGNNNTKTFSNKTPGTYTVTEPNVAGWDLTSITCIGGSDTSDTNVNNRNAVIKLKAGENVTCTFVNTKASYCGNGAINPEEECDDGNTVDTDACSNSCKLPVCGDGILAGSEQCDLGSLLNKDVWLYGQTGCSASCTNKTGPYCGDENIDTDSGEQCDDGGNASGDGCNAICQIEIVRSAEITEPSTLTMNAGLIDFEAYLVDDDADSIQWAIRKDTCAAGSGTVFGNVDGKNDQATINTSDLGNQTFSFSTNMNPGEYCFIYNPTEDAGESEIRLTKEFEIVDVEAPNVPTGIYFKDTVNNKIVSCGGITSARNFDVYWDKNNEPDFDHYEYISFNADGSTGPIRIFSTNYFNASWWTAPIEGVYGVQIRAVDVAGNKSEWFGGTQGVGNSCRYTSDWSGPTKPVIEKPLNEQYFKTTPIRNEWTISTDVSGVKEYWVEYIYDDKHTFSGGPYRIVTTNWRNHVPAINEQGGVTIRVQAWDNVGNASEWSDPVHYYYDATVPAAPTLIAPANNSVVKGIPSLTNSWTSVSDAVKYIYESYHNEGATNRRWHEELPATSKTAPNVADATFWWRVKAVDAAGNESVWSPLWKVTVDNTAPTIPDMNGFLNPNLPCGAFTNVGTVTVDWSDATDANGIAGYEYHINYPLGSNRGNWNTFFTASQYRGSLNEGIHHIEVRARDLAGNISGWSNLCSITYDSAQPSVDLVFPEPIPGSTSFQAVFSENVKEAEAEDPANYFLNNWPGYGGTGNLIDHANISYDAASHTATINFTTPGWYVSPEQKWGVQDIHDLAGNLQSENPYSEYSTPKVAPITAAVLDGTVGTNDWYVSDVTVNLSASDPAIGSGVKTTYYSLDEAGFVAGISVFVDTEKDEHKVEFYSEDNAGNVEAVKSISFKIDKTDPVSSITPLEGEVIDGTIYVDEWDGSFSGTASDNLSGVNRVMVSIHKNETSYWNGTAWSEQTEPILVQASGTEAWSYAGMVLTDEDEGTFVLESHAIDNAGNEENTFTLKIVLDKTIPEVSLSINPRDPDGDNNWYISVPEITLSASDNFKLDRIEYQIDSNSGSWLEYISPVKISEGEHIFYYRAIDKATNVSSVGIKNVKVDTEDPDEVSDVDAEYDEDENSVKLTWNADSSDIDMVYIYRGGSKGFNVSSGSRIAKNDDNDEDFTDHDVERGEKYYYKFVSRDEAGNNSDAKIISVEIPIEEGTAAIVTNEGTEAVPESTVLGAETNNENSGEEQVLGTESQNGEVNGSQTNNESFLQRWWAWILASIGLLGMGGWLWMRRGGSNGGGQIQ